MSAYSALFSEIFFCDNGKPKRGPFRLENAFPQFQCSALVMPSMFRYFYEFVKETDIRNAIVDGNNFNNSSYIISLLSLKCLPTHLQLGKSPLTLTPSLEGIGLAEVCKPNGIFPNLGAS